MSKPIKNEYYRKLKIIRRGFDWYTYLHDHFEVKGATGDELRVECPFCGETDKKMYVNTDTNRFNCFKCERNNGNSDVFDFIAFTEGTSRGQAIMQCLYSFQEVCPSFQEIEDALIEEEEEFENEVKVRHLDSLPEQAKTLSSSDPSAASAIQYLLDRGLTMQEIEDMNTHYVPKGYFPIYSKGVYYGNLADRVLWPIYGSNRKLVSWISRTTNPLVKERKYMNAPDCELAETVWPFVPPRGKTAVLVEGILDCLAIRRLGMDAYATFGKYASKGQLDLLKTWNVESITLSYDKDAKKDVIKSLPNLSSRFNTFVPSFFLPNDQDAGDCLNNPELSIKLKKSLEECIDTTSIKFMKWELFA